MNLADPPNQVLTDLPGSRSSPSEIVPVLIVAFRNAADVNSCLKSLSGLNALPRIAVYICENGGAEAFDNLVSVLTNVDGSCVGDEGALIETLPRFRRITQFRLRSDDRRYATVVQVGEADSNLGYAGGINAYLQSLLAIGACPGVWILNPDTEVDPGTLQELMSHAATHGRGMVGSRLVPRNQNTLVANRGLVWNKWRAASRAVDRLSSADSCLPPDVMDRRLDAASGASIYVTRECLAQTGLMDERYFLYFEDLDWGIRAKRHGLIGYAHKSIVIHQFGTTIGSAASRRDHSALAVYLDFRNRILFVRTHFAWWLPWTVMMEVAELAVYARLGAFRNMIAASRGMMAGILGQTGRPDAILRTHRIPADVNATRAPGIAQDGPELQPEIAGVPRSDWKVLPDAARLRPENEPPWDSQAGSMGSVNGGE